MSKLYLTENSWIEILNLPNNLISNFDKLWALHPEERGEVKIYGKLIKIPRYQQSYLRDYTFSNINSKSIDLPEELQPYLEYLNGLNKYGNFNQVLVNWYENGLSYIGSHRDDEKQLIENSPIVTISLGEERKFRIRDNNNKIVKDIMTKNGLVITMGGNFQKDFKHEIVKINGKKGESIGARISITLRQFL